MIAVELAGDSEDKPCRHLFLHKIYSGLISLIITAFLLVQVHATNRGITDCIIWFHAALLMATVCSVIGIDIYYEGNIKNENEAWKRMEMNCDAKGIGIFSSGLIPEEATGKALASNCDEFGCISMCDLTTQALCACMWHKLIAFCIYGMSRVTFYAAFLSLNGVSSSPFESGENVVTVGMANHSSSGALKVTPGAFKTIGGQSSTLCRGGGSSSGESGIVGIRGSFVVS
jgi:hypothetical protein